MKFCYSKDSNYYVSIQQNKLIVFDIQKNSTISQLELPMLQKTLTCVRWEEPIDSSYSISTSENKKKKKKVSTTAFSPIFLSCGTQDGDIFVWNVHTNQIVSYIPTPSKYSDSSKPIVDSLIITDPRTSQKTLFFTNGQDIFLCDTLESIFRTDISVSSLFSSQKSKPDYSDKIKIIFGNKFLPSITSASSTNKISCLGWFAQHIVVGTSASRVVFIERNSLCEEKRLRCTGHTSGINQIQISSNGLLFSISEDNYVNMYRIPIDENNEEEEENEKGNIPFDTLHLENAPVHMDVATMSSGPKEEEGSVFFAVTAQKGETTIYKIAGKQLKSKKSNKTQKITCTISPKTQNDCIFSAIFEKKLNSESVSDLILSYGSILKPKFTKLSFMEQDSTNSLKMKSKISFSLSEQEKSSWGSSKTEAQAQIERENELYSRESNKGLKILGPMTMEEPAARLKQGFNITPKDEKAADAMIKKMENFDMKKFILKEKDQKPVDKQQQIAADVSFTSTLLQALLSKNHTVIRKCFQQSDISIIKQTVKQIPTSCVLLLLTDLLKEFQETEVKAGNLVAWLQQVLVSHTSFVMSQPQLLQQLTPLYHSIDHRLKFFTQLMDLQGRLNLLLTFAGRQGDAEDGEANILEEDDENEEDIDEDMENIAEDDEMDDLGDEDLDLDGDLGEMDEEKAPKGKKDEKAPKKDEKTAKKDEKTPKKDEKTPKKDENAPKKEKKIKKKKTLDDIVFGSAEKDGAENEDLADKIAFDINGKDFTFEDLKADHESDEELELEKELDKFEKSVFGKNDEDLEEDKKMRTDKKSGKKSQDDDDDEDEDEDEEMGEGEDGEGEEGDFGEEGEDELLAE